MTRITSSRDEFSLLEMFPRCLVIDLSIPLEIRFYVTIVTAITLLLK